MAQNRTRANRDTPIYLVFWYDQLRIKVSTGEKIKPKYWNALAHKAKLSQDFKEGRNLNTRLEANALNVLAVARDHLNENRTILPEVLQAEIVNVLKPKPLRKEDRKPVDLIPTIEECIAKTPNATRTKLSYGTTLNILKRYEKERKKKLSLDSINLDFYDDFIRFLNSVRREKKKKVIIGYSKNTVGDHIKKVKVFMNYALDRGYTNNRGHLHHKFQTMEETADTIFLTEAEIEDIYKLDLSKRTGLDKARDMFIIGCWTGLRFSDLSQLTPEKFIKGGTQVKVKTVKTGEIVIIPLHWMIKEILQKYDGVLPPGRSSQNWNKNLKILGRLARISEKVTITPTIGGMKLEKTRRKWELISVHTSRRSFATNMYLAGVDTISIMKITGHRTERAFMKYIKITADQNADRLSRHPIFAKPVMKVVNHE